MKKCAFIIPYFGRLPGSFPVFLKTCAPNQDFDFLLFTDDDRGFDYPDNVIVIPMQFQDVRSLVQSKFDFEISLNKPYKLCDYKPAYGYIFEDYIKEYSFWGHCDIDIILGDLNSFLSEEILSNYDKLFCLGHMILYRNSFENNRAFMLKAHDRVLYREYYSTDEITAFDETWGPRLSVNDIFLENNKRVLNEDWSVNFSIFPTAFSRIRYNGLTDSFDSLPRERTLYAWEKGKIHLYQMRDGNLKKTEEMYIHFQNRKMRYDKRVLTADSFKAVPNKFLLIKRRIDSKKSFIAESRYHICFHYLEIKWGRLIKRLNRLLGKQ